MSLQQVKKEKLKAIFYTVSSVVLACISIYFLFFTYFYIQEQKQEILKINQQAAQVQQDSLAFTQQIKEARDAATAFIPSNFESFFDPNTTTSELTRMFDTLEQTYQESGENFLIRSINYGQIEESEENMTKNLRVNLSLTTTSNNLVAFLRDIEKTGLSSDKAFYFLDPLSLSFNNISNQSNLEELNIDLQLNILLRK